MIISVQKVVPFTFLSEMVFILLLPSVCSSDEHDVSPDIHPNNKHILEINTQLLFQIELHGLISWASVGILMPVGIIITRISNREKHGRSLTMIYYIHAITQVLAVLVATAGAVMSIKYFDHSFNNNHQRIGLFFYGIIWLQALIGIFRPHRGRKGRGCWFIFHWLMGIAVSLLGVINIYTGLQAYHIKTSKDVRLLTVILTMQISLTILIYLFQEKWNYIQKQIMISH